MAARILLRCLAFLLLGLFLVSGASNPEKPPSKAILQNKQQNIKNQIHISSFLPTTQLDSLPTTIPIVNPTPPTTTPPTFNPIISQPPPPPSIMAPITNPIITPTPVTPPTPITTPTPVTTPVTAPVSSGGAWCIASASASETALQVALDYACGYGGADCSAIQQSGSCYIPNTLRDHASYAFNSYYMKNPGPTSCVFGGTAQLTYTDPSSGNCHYTTTATPTTTPPSTSTPTFVTPPSLTTPPSFTTPPAITIPSGSTDYDGTEPTGTTSNASKTMSCNLTFLLATATFLLSLFTTNYRQIQLLN